MKIAIVVLMILGMLGLAAGNMIRCVKRKHKCPGFPGESCAACRVRRERGMEAEND
ncbi:MAG: hypothetical protein U0L09_07465 [Christensenellales bacterium]|nr:hypothetical protein [Christensenellales bacterium]